MAWEMTSSTSPGSFAVERQIKDGFIDVDVDLGRSAFEFDVRGLALQREDGAEAVLAGHLEVAEAGYDFD